MVLTISALRSSIWKNFEVAVSKRPEKYPLAKKNVIVLIITPHAERKNLVRKSRSSC